MLENDKWLGNLQTFLKKFLDAKRFSVFFFLLSDFQSYLQLFNL